MQLKLKINILPIDCSSWGGDFLIENAAFKFVVLEDGNSWG